MTKIKPDEAFNGGLETQHQKLIHIIIESPVLNTIFSRAPLLDIENYYIGAGCITQTIWNYQSRYPLDYGIGDIDFVYFNEDMSGDEEKKIIDKVSKLFSDIPIKFDVKNQARVHIWYEQHFGYPIKPYKSLEEAIVTWPTTATAVGIRRWIEEWKIYAPFGLDDLFGKIVRANKEQITQEIFEKKVNKWCSLWPDLKVIPWNEE